MIDSFEKLLRNLSLGQKGDQIYEIKKEIKNIKEDSVANNKEQLNNSANILDNDSEDLSFYDKYNYNKNVINNEFIEKKKTLKKRKKQEHTELEEIKHIIKQDAQTLNNPSLYYQQLFLNHIQKRSRRHNNIFTISSNKTQFPIKGKSENYINFNSSIKRTSTDLKNNNSLGLSVKKIYKRSSIVIPSRFKKI